jgi:hypothetical protein
MHPADAAMVRAGRALRPLTRTPGMLDEATCQQLFGNPPSTLPATEVEHEVLDGDVLAIAGGELETPGVVQYTPRAEALERPIEYGSDGANTRAESWSRALLHPP